MSATVFTLVAALGAASCCGQVRFRGSEPGDAPAGPLAPAAPARYGGTFLALVQDALWSALAGACLHTLTGDWPGWFPPALALFWAVRLLAATLTLDVAAHREDWQDTWALRLLTQPVWVLAFWAIGVAGSIGIAVFWVTLLVGLLRR